MNLHITIRAANTNDTNQLLPLLEQLGYPQAYDTLKERIKAYIDHSDHYIFIACSGNDAVGLLTCGVIESFLSPGRTCRITSLVVDYKYRGQGIGRKLLEYLEDFARNNSIKIIDLTSGMRRAQEGTHEFYNKLGYRNEGLEAKVYLRKKL